MNEDTIVRLESSFNLLAPRGEELVDRFYAQLFNANPGVRGMFPQSMVEQKKKLLASVALVVKSLRNAEALRQPLLEMGARHGDYGTLEEHYPIVRDTLVGVMREMAGAQWNEQLTADWTAALNFVAGIMIEGQKSAASTGKSAR